MSERKIGEIFFDGNVTLQVENGYKLGCHGCYYGSDLPFLCTRNHAAAGWCTGTHRTDHQDVIFKEIKL